MTKDVLVCTHTEKIITHAYRYLLLILLKQWYKILEGLHIFYNGKLHNTYVPYKRRRILAVFYLQNSNGSDDFGDLDTDGSIILKFVTKNRNWQR